jgi:hypothetical protein
MTSLPRQATKTARPPKSRKLALQKETLKDLAPANATTVKGGAPPITNKNCGVKVVSPTTGC